VTRDELGESLRYAGGLHHLQRVGCARNHVLLGVWPPLANSVTGFLVERQRRTSHHEQHRLPDLPCSTRIELPRSDARQLGLEESPGIRFRLFGSAWNGALGGWPPSGPEDEAEEAIDPPSRISRGVTFDGWCQRCHVWSRRSDPEQRRLEQRQRPHGVRRVARKIERDERAAGMSDDVSGTDAKMRQQLRRIRRGTRHEALGRSSDRRTVPVAATPVVNLLETSQRRLVHQREEGVRDPRAVYEQHRVAGAVHHVLDVSSVNWGPLQVSSSWHCGIMRLPGCRETQPCAGYFA
jgi:hypothetical protein